MTYIVDTHTHVTSPDLQKYPRFRTAAFETEWVDKTTVDVDGLAAEMTAAGVDRAVLVQAFGAYQFDNRYVTDAMALHPEQFGAMVIIDPAQPDPHSALREFKKRGARGLRLFSIPTPEEPWIDSPAAAPLWESAAALDFRIVACVLAPEIPVVGRAMDAHPDLVVALDHCGFADFTQGPPFAAASPLWELADKANIRLKVTTTLLDQAAAYGGDGSEIIDALVANFGADRLMWGSDYPQVHDRTYTETLAAAQQATANLSAEQRQLFFAGTALKLWPELG